MEDNPDQTVSVYVGDRIPGGFRPLGVIATSRVADGETILEAYGFMLGADGSREVIAEFVRCEFDLNELSGVISLDLVVQGERDWLAAQVAQRVLETNPGWKDALSYEFREADPSVIFNYKWRYGFVEKLRRVRDQTNNAALKNLLRKYVTIKAGEFYAWEPPEGKL